MYCFRNDDDRLRLRRETPDEATRNTEERPLRWERDNRPGRGRRSPQPALPNEDMYQSGSQVEDLHFAEAIRPRFQEAIDISERS